MTDRQLRRVIKSTLNGWLAFHGVLRPRSYSSEFITPQYVQSLLCDSRLLIKLLSK